jgi:hypothetical protein
LDEAHTGTSTEERKVHSPQEIANRVGGISVKTLAELIRHAGLETTTLGYAEPSRRGGRARRLWGMTDDQLERLLSFREQRGQAAQQR